MKEINFEEHFDRWFEDIDVSSDDKSEKNSVSYKSIIEAYEESKEQY